MFHFNQVLNQSDYVLQLLHFSKIFFGFSLLICCLGFIQLHTFVDVVVYCVFISFLSFVINYLLSFAFQHILFSCLQKHITFLEANVILKSSTPSFIQKYRSPSVIIQVSVKFVSSYGSCLTLHFSWEIVAFISVQFLSVVHVYPSLVFQMYINFQFKSVACSVPF